MTHQHTLRFFLQTDLYRLEASLDESIWTAPIAERLTDHLRFTAQLRAVFLEGLPPHDAALQRRLEAIAPQDMEQALDTLHEQTEALIDAIEQVSQAHLNALVLDPHERGFTVLGHLYDFCRANAMLVEWAKGLSSNTSSHQGTLRELVGQDSWMSDEGNEIDYFD